MISLLANIYLNSFNRIMSNATQGKFAKASIRMVRYTDDFVLMGRQRHRPQIIGYINRISQANIYGQTEFSKFRILS